VRLAKTLLEALLVGAATFAGVRVMQELQDPYSGLRLRGSETLDRLREVTK
jgi:hypothetical protein